MKRLILAALLVSAAVPACAANDGMPDGTDQYKCGIAGVAYVAEARSTDRRIQHTLRRTALVDGACYAEVSSVITLEGFGYVFGAYVVNAYTMTPVAHLNDSQPYSAALASCSIKIGPRRTDKCTGTDYTRFSSALFGDSP